jgi:hypothetical protein
MNSAEPGHPGNPHPRYPDAAQRLTEAQQEFARILGLLLARKWMAEEQGTDALAQIRDEPDSQWPSGS